MFTGKDPRKWKEHDNFITEIIKNVSNFEDGHSFCHDRNVMAFVCLTKLVAEIMSADLLCMADLTKVYMYNKKCNEFPRNPRPILEMEKIFRNTSIENIVLMASLDL